MSQGIPKRPILKKVTTKAIDVDATTDEMPFEPNVAATMVESSEPIRDTAQEDSIAFEYVGKWNHLVSQTNWEKGRIIVQWRETAVAQSLDAVAYSDEAWARKVEGVTAQHVGRLRRVFVRFSECYASFPKLYWSHFLAALDWDDAEMWLEGATQSGWSVSQMRHQRWQATGANPAETPESKDIVAVETDDGFEALAAIEDEDNIESDDNDRITTGPLAEGPDFGDADNESNNVATAEDASSEFESIEMVNPFADLPQMPDDVAEAFEHMKLAIVRHRCRDWEEISQSDMVKVTDVLRRFAQMTSA